MSILNEDFTKLYKRWKGGDVRNEDKIEYEYVDLDLPSGKLWATCNIGAKHPFELGDYYAWGEVKTKKEYTWGNYLYGTYKDLKKYNDDDGNKILEKHDDVVYVKTKGEAHMPTKDDFEELIKHTNSVCCSLNGIPGILLYSKKNTMKNLFIPAAGFICDDDTISCNKYIYMWTSSVNECKYYAYFAILKHNNFFINHDNRYCGYSVRGVKEK